MPLSYLSICLSVYLYILHVKCVSVYIQTFAHSRVYLCICHMYQFSFMYSKLQVASNILTQMPTTEQPATPCPRPSVDNVVCSGHGTCAAGSCACSSPYCGPYCNVTACQATCSAGYWGPACASECVGGAATPCSGHGNCSSGIYGGQGAAACGSTPPDVSPKRFRWRAPSAVQPLRDMGFSFVCLCSRHVHIIHSGHLLRAHTHRHRHRYTYAQ